MFEMLAAMLITVAGPPLAASPPPVPIAVAAKGSKRIGGKGSSGKGGHYTSGKKSSVKSTSKPKSKK